MGAGYRYRITDTATGTTYESASEAQIKTGISYKDFQIHGDSDDVFIDDRHFHVEKLPQVRGGVTRDFGEERERIVLERGDDFEKDELFWEFFIQWIEIYKRGAVRDITLHKYEMAAAWLKELAPTLKIKDLNRVTYQRIINQYAETHEKQTVQDFHHQVKGAIMDAIDEGLIPRDPTRKTVMKGKRERKKKPKFLNKFELQKLLEAMELKKDEITWEWLLTLIAKTGMRFSEALALTPADFDFSRQLLSINKTWDYKSGTGFMPTKNQSSVRKIELDWRTIAQFSDLVKGLPVDQPIFVKDRNKPIYNATVNSILARYCQKAGVPVITIHGLRHTHASMLIYEGVSIPSVARRLGHASITTTQRVYLHIIQELQNADVDTIMRSISNL